MLKSPKTVKKYIQQLLILLLSFNIIADIMCNKEKNKTNNYDELNLFNEIEIKELGNNSESINKILSKLESFYIDRNNREKLYSGKNK